MRKHPTLLVALLVFALGCFAPGVTHSQDKKSEGQTAPAPPDADERARAAEVMAKLRNALLTAPPQEIGIEDSEGKAKVLAVLMETALPAGVATLVSIHDGTASLYTTTGGGIMGGYSAREEARKFVAEAGKHLSSMKPAQTFPYPPVGRIRFYVRTPDGVYTAEAVEEELLYKRHALSPLFHAGHGVLTGLRKATEGARRGNGR
jgi:hypothetical protein